MTSSESGVELSGSSDGIISNPAVITKHGQIVQEIMDITGAWKRYSNESLHKTSPPRKLFKRPSLPASLSWSTKKAAKPINVPPAGCYVIFMLTLSIFDRRLGQKKLIISFLGTAPLHFHMPHLSFYSVN